MHVGVHTTEEYFFQNKVIEKKTIVNTAQGINIKIIIHLLFLSFSLSTWCIIGVWVQS